MCPSNCWARGDYDVAAVLRTLADVRYRGPVGVQFDGLKGDPQKNLETAMRAWRTLIPLRASP